MRPGETAPELAVARRRPLPPPCVRCGHTGHLRILVDRGTLPYRPGDVEYCTCPRGARAERDDRRDFEDYYGEIERAYAASWDRNLGLGKSRMRAWTLDSFPRTAAPSYHTTAMRFVEGFAWDRNLVLCGKPGTGKTGLMIGMARALRERAIAERRIIRFVTAPDMFDSLKQGFNDHTYAAQLEGLKTCALLLLDDLGAEHGTSWAMDRLFAILNARYNDELPTWITSNLNVDKNGVGPLADWLGGRLVSRLLETGAPLLMNGRDLRMR